VSGVYRRRIRLAADGLSVTADLEDDFHRFGVDLVHDGEKVISVRGRARRFPWTTCAAAVEPLAALEGMPLSTDATAAGAWADPRANCTHLFDLAGLAVAHAASGREHRQYDVEVPDRDVEGGWTTQPRLWRNGELVLSWALRHLTIEAPHPFAGVALRGAFMRWARDALDPDTAEAAIVLRRACEISYGRLQDLDGYDVAADLGDVMLGTCHTFQPGTMEVGIRRKGSGRDFSDAPDGLLE
jgi:hypothetical protein